MSSIGHIIKPKVKDLGDGFQVRRSFPQVQKRFVGPFVFWDHMGPVSLSSDNEMKVRAHPHIGLSTITYLFSGAIMHRDSLGNEQLIRPGEVNWMTAGQGIVHSERTETDSEGQTLEGIQLWVALPKKDEDVAPSFVHCKEEELPLIHREGMQLRLIAGSLLGENSPLPVYSPLFYCKGEACEQAHFSLELPSTAEAAIYITKGKMKVESHELQRFDLVVFKKGEPVSFQALDDCEFMLFGGDVFPEKRHIWWNFVSSDKQKIEEAKEKWQSNKYPSVINEEEFIPLPEDV